MMFFQILLLFLTARADLQKPFPYVGLHAGLTDSTGPSTAKEVHPSYGARAGFVFFDHVALGGYFNYYANTSSSENIAYAPILAEILYYPHHTPYDVNTFYVGGAFGSTQMVISNSSGRSTDNPTTVALTAGYSLRLWGDLMIGPEAQYFFVSSDTDSFRLTTVHVSVKYNF